MSPADADCKIGETSVLWTVYTDVLRLTSANLALPERAMEVYWPAFGVADESIVGICRDNCLIACVQRVGVQMDQCVLGR